MLTVFAQLQNFLQTRCLSFTFFMQDIWWPGDDMKAFIENVKNWGKQRVH